MTSESRELDDDATPDQGSGRGGPLGTPGSLPDEAPPDTDQEANEAVSGGGVVGPDDDAGPSTKARPSRDD